MNNIDKTLNIYRNFLELKWKGENLDIKKFWSESDIHCLSPKEINQLIHELNEINYPSDNITYIVDEGYLREQGFNKASLLNYLIEESYQKGNREFTLEVGDSNFVFLGNLSGEENSKIVLNVIGNVGAYFASGSNLEVFLKGNAGDLFGRCSHKNSYDVQGNLGDRALENSDYNVFKGKGNVGDWFNKEGENNEIFFEGHVGIAFGLKSKDCKYTLKGDIGDYVFAAKSKNNSYLIQGSFKLPKEKVVRKREYFSQEDFPQNNVFETSSFFTFLNLKKYFSPENKVKFSPFSRKL